MGSTTRWVLLATAILALVIVPFVLFEATVEAAVAEFLASDPPRLTLGLAIVGVMAADIVLPVPSSVVATAAGTLLGVGWGSLANLVGLGIGCVIGYAIGAAGRGIAGRVVGSEQLSLAERLFERRGEIVVAVFRPIPVLAEISVVFAGVARMGRTRFALYAMLANVGIAVAYAGIGAWAAAANEMVVAVAASLILPGLAMLAGRLATRSEQAG